VFTAIALYFQDSISLSNSIHTFHLIFIPFFWFIVLICSLYCLTPALRIFIQSAGRRDIVVVVLLWLIAICVLPYIRDTQAFPLHVDNSIVRLVISFIGYFFLGFLIRTTKLHKKYLASIGIILVTSVIGRSALEYFSIHSYRQFYNGPDFIDPGLVITAVSLFTLFYMLEDYFQRIFTYSIKTIIIIISDATLGIYFVHYLFLNRAPLPFLFSTTSLIRISYNIDLFINAFIFFVLSFIIIFLLQKIPIIKRLIT
jgi:surface polysaccharide O-acyltransferase-like enzyme